MPLYLGNNKISASSSIVVETETTMAKLTIDANLAANFVFVMTKDRSYQLFDDFYNSCTITLPVGSWFVCIVSTDNILEVDDSIKWLSNDMINFNNQFLDIYKGEVTGDGIVSISDDNIDKT